MKSVLLKIILIGLFSIITIGFSQQYNESNDFSYALKLFNEGFYDISAQQFSSFINNYPTSDKLAEAKYYLAESLYRINEYQNARVEFQSLAVTFPNHERAPYAWKMVGDLYLKLKKYKDAAKAFETVKVLYPDHALAPQSLLKAAEAYLELDSFNQADRILKEFLDRYVDSPEYPEGHLIYGKLLAKNGNFERARNEFERANSLTKDKNISARANFGIASVYHKLGLLNQASTYYQNAIAINPKTEIAYNSIFSLAQIHQNMREWDQAITLLEKNRKDFINSEDQIKADEMLAQSYFLKSDYLSAQKILEKILYSTSNVSDKNLFYFYLAACYQQEEKNDKAIENYVTLIQATHNDSNVFEFIPAAYINLIKLYLENANIPKAHQYLTEFHRNYPSHFEGESIYASLIKKAFEAGDVSYAVDELQKFQIEFPGSHLQDDLIYDAGNAFFKNGNYSESRKYYQKLSESYYCTYNFNSIKTKLDFINSYLLKEEGLGVSELAHLMGRMLSNENRTDVMMDLGIIYLKNLKDFKSASQIFEKCKSETNDSSIVGKALYYLSESYMAQAQIEAFPESPRNKEAEKAIGNLKEAMAYIKYVPHPDSLMFRFLVWTIPPENSHSKKALEFWKHFETSFPKSPLLENAQLKLADISSAIGNNDQTLIYLNKIISNANDPLTTGRAYWKKAAILEKSAKKEVAIQTLKDFLLTASHHPDEAKAYWQLANYHAEMGDYSSAVKFLERLLQHYNYTDFSQDAKIKIVDYYILNGDFITAFNYIKSQIKDIPLYDDPIVKYYLPVSNVDFYFYAGKARFQQKEYQESRENIIKYLSLSSNQSYREESFYLLGKISFEESNPESALMYFSLISNTKSPFFFNKANEIAADILFTNGDFSKAQLKYESLIATTNDVNKKIYYESQKLRCLVNEGNVKFLGSGLAEFQRQYKKHPEFDSYIASIEFEEGKRDYFNKNFDPALKHFSTVLRKYKNSGFADDALYYQGLCYTTLNKSDDALDKFTKFLKEYPNSPILGDVYNSIANLYIRGEKTDLAMGALQKAVETASSPESQKNAISNLIKLYKNLGMWDSSLQLSRQYVEKFPNADDIVDKKVLIGNCLTNLNRYSEAVDYLKKVKFEATAEQEPEIQFYIGEAYYNAGRYEEAIGEFVKIPLLSKKTKLQWEASALYYSGQAYEKMARIGDAVRMYNEIVQRPGILLELKREAQRRIDSLTN